MLQYGAQQSGGTRVAGRANRPAGLHRPWRARRASPCARGAARRRSSTCTGSGVCRNARAAATADARRDSILRRSSSPQEMGAETPRSRAPTRPRAVQVRARAQLSPSSCSAARRAAGAAAGARPHARRAGARAPTSTWSQMARPTHARRQRAPREPRREAAQERERDHRAGRLRMSAAICAPSRCYRAAGARFELANIVMLFLLARGIVAVRFGRGPAVLAAFLSVAAFDFFFVPPRLSFAVTDVQYLLTFAVMLVSASSSASSPRACTTRRAWRSSAKTAWGDVRNGARPVRRADEPSRWPRSARASCSRVQRAAPHCSSADADDLMVVRRPRRAGIDPSVAAVGLPPRPSRPAKAPTRCPASPALYLPLKAPMRVRGVLAVEPREPAATRPRAGAACSTPCASLLAISLERIHYVEVASSTMVQDGVRTAAQLAAGRHLARPAHAAHGARRPGRVARADAAAAAPAHARTARRSPRPRCA